MSGFAEKLEAIMSDFSSSMKSRMRDHWPWKKIDSTPLARLKGADALSITDGMERLERIVADSIGKLKQSVHAGEAIVLEETRQAEQLVGDLRTEIAELQGKLKEAGDNIEQKDVSYKQLEVTLYDKIKMFETEMKKKDELLATRENDIRRQKSELDAHNKKISELELANSKTKEELASHIKRAEDFVRISQERVSGLEAELDESKRLVGKKSSTIKTLEEQLATKAQQFKQALKETQELLNSRDSEIASLRSQLQALLKGIDEMSSLFRRAQALTEKGQEDSALVQNEMGREAEAKPQPTPAAADPVKPAGSDALPEIVAPEIFERVIQELAQASNIMAKLALLIVHDHVKALGETVEQFPRTRLPELIEALAKDIADENVQTGFRQRVAESAELTLH
jgi:chromosome segregation ATPase